MRESHRWGPRVVAAVCCLVSSVVIAACSDGPTGPGPIPESDLRVLTSNGVEPDISGSNVVWRTLGGSLVLHDLSNGTETVLTDPETNAQTPLIDGDRVAFNYPTQEPGTSEIGVDIGVIELDPGGARLREFTTPDADEGMLVIADDRVAFLRDLTQETEPNARFKIVVLNLDTEEESVIASGAIPTNRMGLDGTRLVWSEKPERDPPSLRVEVFLHDLDSGQTRRISPKDDADDSRQWSPDVSGERVVWVDGVDGRDVFLLDLPTGQLENLTSDQVNQQPPRIDGELIVWVEPDSFDGDTEIVLFNASTNTRRRLTDDEFDQRNPAISDGRVVWEERRNGERRVVVGDVR